jgi:hypothetical protein
MNVQIIDNSNTGFFYKGYNLPYIFSYLASIITLTIFGLVIPMKRINYMSLILLSSKIYNLSTGLYLIDHKKREKFNNYLKTCFL